VTEPAATEPAATEAAAAEAAVAEAVKALPACDVCRRPRVVCVCDRIVSFPTVRRVLILQHPREQDALLGSAQIVIASLPKAKLVVGLSWRNLGHALGEEEADPQKWAVLYPDREAEGDRLTTRRGRPLDPKSLEGIIVLDGTWSKAKSLWWRNPWLIKLNRMSLQPTQPSIYGRLRAEPRRDYVSTLESVGGALTICGESVDVEKGLSRVFRTLMQRTRDANLAPEERKLPKKPKGPGNARRSEVRETREAPAASEMTKAPSFDD
jgi:DTW domain-containing protein YfiP